MPSISEATNQDMSGYVPATPSPQASLPPTVGLEPTLNPVIRCPLPPIFQAQPDSLRQFYQPKVPQTRLLSALTNGNSSGNNTTTVETETITNSSTSTTIKLKSASITTSILSPNQSFVGTMVNVNKSFQLVNVAANAESRITLYGTKLAQTGDLYRTIDQPPPAGTVQGIITDVVLDTPPLQWNFQDRIGCNNDVPQTQNIYITVTNLTSAAVAITVTLQVISLEV